jgi:site-specific recombinase XerD
VTVAELTDDEMAWLEARRRQSRPALSDDELICGYVTDMCRRDLAPSTRATFRRMLARFSRAHPAGFGAVTREDVERWVDEQHCASRARAWLVTVLRSFYVWAVSTGHLDVDPTRDIIRRHKARDLPRPIPDAELCAAIDQADDMMRCWLLLGALQGLRSMEIAGLTRDDVQERAGLLRVRGKGRKERMLPLHPDVLDALERLPMPKRGGLFLRADGRPYTAAKVSQRASEHLHNCGSQSTTHSLRHWFGTAAYQSSLDLRLVQDLLGHESPISTAIYAAADGTRARPVVEGLAIPGRHTRATLPLVDPKGPSGIA